MVMEINPIMCERCRRICEDRRIAQLEIEIRKDKEKLEMLEALKDQLRTLEIAVGLRTHRE